MSSLRERTILEEGQVKITNHRAIIATDMGTEIYRITQITSVNLNKVAASKLPHYMVIVSAVFVVVGFSDLQEFAICLVIGLIVGVAGIVAMQLRPTYKVQIRNVLGETDIVESQDKGYVKRIVDAIHEAIVTHPSLK